MLTETCIKCKDRGVKKQGAVWKFLLDLYIIWMGLTVLLTPENDMRALPWMALMNIVLIRHIDIFMRKSQC